jgi:hypothetical protein
MRSLADVLAWCGTPPADRVAGGLGWILVAAAALAVAIAFAQSVRFLCRPGEDAPDHVKRSIFGDRADT